MLNVADGKPMRLTVGGERFDLSTGTILAYERTLELRPGRAGARGSMALPGRNRDRAANAAARFILPGLMWRPSTGR